MSIALLKKLNQITPDAIKNLAAPVIRKQLTGNRTFLDQFSFLEKAKEFTEDETNNWQVTNLRDLLMFAYEEVPYYKEIFDEAAFDPLKVNYIDDIKKLPLLTKDIIKERFDDLQAKSIEDYYLATTGGSTGVPMKVNLERASIYKEKAFIYNYWSDYGYDWKSSRIATFRGVDFGGKLSKPNPLYNEILLNPFVLNEENIGDFVRKIDKFGAEYIHGYPSAINNFCLLLKKKGLQLKKPVKCVFFISEDVNRNQALFIESVLGCKSRAFYGHSERAIFAGQIDDEGHYKFSPYYGVTEIEEHALGNIVCTGFLNKRMPLIRYAVDDEAEYTQSGYLIKGHHTGDCISGKHGEKISQTALNFHDSSMDLAEAYQIVQKEKGIAEFRIKAARHLTDAEIDSVKRALEEKTQQAIEWAVLQDVDFILTQRGKCKTIVILG